MSVRRLRVSVGGFLGNLLTPLPSSLRSRKKTEGRGRGMGAKTHRGRDAYFAGKYFSMVSLLGGFVPKLTKSISSAEPRTIGTTGR